MAGYSDMDIKHIEKGEEGYFKAMDGENTAGELSYTSRNGDRIIINHTEVKPQYRGQDVGKNMVLKAVEYARENELKIVPACSFAKAMFERSAELRDVL